MQPRAIILTAVLAALALCVPALAADSHQAGATFLLSRDSGLGTLPAQGDGASFSSGEAVSGDGRYVAFVSEADDLGVSDALRHVFVRDDQTGAVTLLDRAGPGGAISNGSAQDAAISRDGSKVCFTSYADNLVAGAGQYHVYVVTVATGAIVVADRATGGAIGDRQAQHCALDADGGVVAFESAATNLGVAGGGNHVYARDLAAGTTQLVDSYNGTPGDGGADMPSIDANGQIVAFETYATNLNGPGGDPSNSDVYLRGLASATPVLVSRANGGGGAIGNGWSGDPSVSDDGLTVAFTSQADNLNDGDSDQTQDVHVRNVIAGTTTLASRADGAGGAKADHGSYSPVLAGDAGTVSFLSEADNMGASPPPNDEGNDHVAYLRVLGTGTTMIVDRASGAGGAVSDNPGRVALDLHAAHAVWEDASAGLDPLANGIFAEVFERHLTGAFETKLISRPQDASGRPAQAGSVQVDSRMVSADGRYVVFSSPSPFDGQPGGTPQVYVRDTLLGTTRLVSRADGADGAAASREAGHATISADGTKVAFTSAAGNLAAGAAGSHEQVYVRDLIANTTTLVSTGAAGASDAGASDPALSQDGTKVAFRSWSGNLVPGDGNGQADIFVRDLVAGTTVNASLNGDGAQLNGNSQEPAISADGTRVGLLSNATNAGGGASGGGDQHIYVRDLAAGTLTLVDRRADGAPADKTASTMTMSADGNRFAFESQAKLTAEAQNGSSDVFLRDVAAGTTVMASLAPDGSESGEQAFLPGISLDGSKVAFYTLAKNQPAGSAPYGGLYERDLVAGTTTLVSARDGSDTPSDDGGENPSLDADGGCVAFVSSDSSLGSPAYAGHDINQLWMRAMHGECPVHAPDTTITSGPDGRAKVRQAYSVFGYRADESGATFACSLDSTPAKPCSDSFHTGLLRDGVHRFSVVATDHAGNTDPTPAMVTFTVGVPPRVTKLRIAHGRVVFRLSERAKVRVKVSRAGRTRWARTRTLHGGLRHVKLPRLHPGRYRVLVTAVDAGGNRAVPKHKRLNVKK